jgi:hypothetical protein
MIMPRQMPQYSAKWGMACTSPQAQGFHQCLSTVTDLQPKPPNQSGFDDQKFVLPKYHPEEIKNKQDVQLKTLVFSLIILRPSAELKPLSVSATRKIFIRCQLFSPVMRIHLEKEDRPRDVNLSTVQASAFL